jgi:hypothetical protein
MKHYLIIVAFCATMSSCSNPTGQTAQAAVGSTASSAPGDVVDGKWSAVIDGQAVSGSVTDEPLSRALIYPNMSLNP